MDSQPSCRVSDFQRKSRPIVGPQLPAVSCHLNKTRCSCRRRGWIRWRRAVYIKLILKTENSYSLLVFAVTTGCCFNRRAGGGHNDGWMEVKRVKKTLVTQRYSREPLHPPSILLAPGWGSVFVQLYGFLIRDPTACSASFSFSLPLFLSPFFFICTLNLLLCSTFSFFYFNSCFFPSFLYTKRRPFNVPVFPFSVFISSFLQQIEISFPWTLAILPLTPRFHWLHPPVLSSSLSSLFFPSLLCSLLSLFSFITLIHTILFLSLLSLLCDLLVSCLFQIHTHTHTASPVSSLEDRRGRTSTWTSQLSTVNLSYISPRWREHTPAASFPPPPPRPPPRSMTEVKSS